MSARYPFGPIMSVSNPTRSPASITRLPHSWNHGFVRGPLASSRHSTHSPSWAMFVSCSTAHSWFSVMPGRSASRMRSTATSHTSIASLMHCNSSAVLIRRASSAGSWASNSVDARVAEALGEPRLASVDGEAAVRTGVLQRQGDDLARPPVAHLGHPRPGHEVERRRRRRGPRRSCRARRRRAARWRTRTGRQDLRPARRRTARARASSTPPCSGRPSRSGC